MGLGVVADLNAGFSGEDFLGHRALAAALRSQRDALALELPEVAERVARSIEDPVDLIVDAPERPEIR